MEDGRQEYADGYRDGYLQLATLPHESNVYTRAFKRAVRKTSK